jgi:ferredoxin
MLAINPDECIDCGVCEPECPAEAIVPDAVTGAEKWLGVNREYAAKWPNIVRAKDPPKDADQWKGVKGKFDAHFDPAPGEGNKR